MASPSRPLSTVQAPEGAQAPEPRQSASTTGDGTPPAVRVALVDDHPVLRHGLRLLLRRQGIEIVGDAGSAAEAWEMLGREQLDVVVLELGLPDEPGVELCKRLLERWPERAVLIYTGVAQDEELGRALDCGAQGYLLKTASTDELVEAIRTVAEGESYLDPGLGPLLVVHDRARPAGLLTTREREMLTLLARGHTGEAIAERLHLAPETVRTHVRNAMAKLGAATRTHAVALAVRRGEIIL